MRSSWVRAHLVMTERIQMWSSTVSTSSLADLLLTRWFQFNRNGVLLCRRSQRGRVLQYAGDADTAVSGDPVLSNGSNRIKLRYTPSEWTVVGK